MIALISDVHGNYPALAAVLREIDKLGCSEIISLGDVAGYYCMLNECVREFRARGVVHLRGNHDDYLLTGKGSPRSSSANRCLAHQTRTLDPGHREWLARSPAFLSRAGASMVHGGWEDPIDEYLYEVRPGYFAGRKEKFFFSGHTHVQVLADMGAKIYCNPGSVGQPRDGDARAAFALWDGSRILLRRVEYDYELICRAMREAGFDAYYWANLRHGTRIGGAVSATRVFQ